MDGSVGTKDDLATTRDDVAALQARLDEFESRMTYKLYAAVAAGVGLVKALDWLVG